MKCVFFHDKQMTIDRLKNTLIQRRRHKIGLLNDHYFPREIYLLNLKIPYE